MKRVFKPVVAKKLFRWPSLSWIFVQALKNEIFRVLTYVLPDFAFHFEFCIFDKFI